MSNSIHTRGLALVEEITIGQPPSAASIMLVSNGISTKTSTPVVRCEKNNREFIGGDFLEEKIPK